MKRVLVIEDEKLMANVWKMKFSHLGYEVHCIFDGKEGLEEMKKSKFDVILLDLNLPGMHGLDVLSQKGDTLNANTAVYVITNSMDDSDIDRAKVLGANKTFLKYRISPNEVVQLVEGAAK